MAPVPAVPAVLGEWTLALDWPPRTGDSVVFSSDFFVLFSARKDSRECSWRSHQAPPSPMPVVCKREVNFIHLFCKRLESAKSCALTRARGPCVQLRPCGACAVRAVGSSPVPALPEPQRCSLTCGIAPLTFSSSRLPSTGLPGSQGTSVSPRDPHRG